MKQKLKVSSARAQGEGKSQESKGRLGFTLIELLAVMVVIIVVGSLIVGIMFSSLRATNKANTLTTIRQNGNFAITQMAKVIRDAKVYYGVRVLPTPKPTYPEPEFSPLCQEGVEYHLLKVKTFDDNEIIFNCEDAQEGLDGKVASNGANLVDVTSVAVKKCSFTCFQSSQSSFPTISINLSLAQQGEIFTFEKKATIDFQTSITLRNLNR